MKGPAHELWHLRLKACQYVAFLRGTGCKKEPAREQVSDAFGFNESERSAGPERLRTWGRRLEDHFDPFLVTDALETAKNLGSWYRHFKDKTDLDPYEREELESLEKRYGPAALTRDGRRFFDISPLENHD